MYKRINCRLEASKGVSQAVNSKFRPESVSSEPDLPHFWRISLGNKDTAYKDKTLHFVPSPMAENLCFDPEH